MAEITVRPATIDDAPGVAAAHTRAWQVAYEGLVPQDYLDSLVLEERTDLWRELLANVALPDGTPAPADYVAEVDGNVVGFANVGVFREVPDDTSSGELWAMYVHPDQWGTGAGYALMLETVAHFQRHGVERGYLWVLEDNARARGFYERQGWVADEATKSDDFGDVDLLERRYSLMVPPAD